MVGFMPQRAQRLCEAGRELCVNKEPQYQAARITR